MDLIKDGHGAKIREYEKGSYSISIVLVLVCRY